MNGHKRHKEALEGNKEGSGRKRAAEVGRSLGVEVFLTGSTAAVSRYDLGWVSSSAFSSRLDGWRDGAGSRVVEARRGRNWNQGLERRHKLKADGRDRVAPACVGYVVWLFMPLIVARERPRTVSVTARLPCRK